MISCWFFEKSCFVLTFYVVSFLVFLFLLWLYLFLKNQNSFWFVFVLRLFGVLLFLS